MSIKQNTKPSQSAQTDNDDLLDVYLALSGRQRDERFAPTIRAAVFAGVSQRTIQWWIEAGVIRAVRVGRRHRVSVDSLKAYLKGQADESGSQEPV